ncbi:hypothetical protein SAMN05444392_101522 [Seinonella peptonophila]|uniref:Uncharacterized protein n=1 Tax=Seinonella peptonophila TaxID=112248 RepID=A0A1M4TL85_9BACL|nr:hypothetical protein [Seinonella peptonophila]SHE45253.1 hypothetical protein SAMN05444392_101522 [Seinonella peptonophila]
MTKKRRIREKQKHQPPKPHYALQANRFNQLIIAPLVKEYNRLMSAGLYDEAIQVYQSISSARKQQKILLHKKDKYLHSK